MEHSFCPYCMSPVEEGKPCGVCGLTQGSYTPSPHHLPPGTVLKERYLVGRVLGEGGFGITYIGCDLQLELKVAIKEYFPTDKASRVSQATLEVSSYTGAAGVNYDKGMKKFLQEARTIARMDKQPVIVNVRDFFEINHTAYIVMEYVEGTTFKELVEQRGGRIPAGELLYRIEPLFFALKEMHGNGLIHRDISPENLMLEKGEVRLLDFGCARESADGGNTMTIALKHGYAPVEQYQSKGQGPWTDVYALSATIYYCLTGRKPPQAMDRLVEDELIPPRKLGVDLTQRQEQALLYGMGVAPKRRFQSMDEFHTALYEGDGSAAAPEAGGRAEPTAAGSAAKPGSAEAAGKTAGEGRPDAAGETAGTNRAGSAGKTAETDRADSAGKTAETDRADAAGKTAETDRADGAGKTVEKDRADSAGKTVETAPETTPGTEKTEKKPFDLAVWLQQNRLLAGGAAAVLALAVLLAAVLPRLLGQAAGADGSAAPAVPAQTASASPAQTPSGEDGLPQGSDDREADNAVSFLRSLEDDSVDTVTVREGIEVNEPVTLTKALRIESGAWVNFHRGLTVAAGGSVSVGVSGSLESVALLRTVDGGTVSVDSLGHVGTQMLWLEREEDLTVGPGGAVDVWGGTDPTKDELDAGAQSHYLVLDEAELFSGAIPVHSEAEFAQSIQGTAPIVIDSDFTLTQNYWVRVPVLIPEGVTVNAPCPDPGKDEGNCTLEMCHGTVLVNHGTLLGRVAMHGTVADENGNWIGDDPSYLINFGTVDANLYTELAAVINLGEMTTREVMRNGTLANVGNVTLDGLLEVKGNWSNNGGTFTIARFGELKIYGGTGWNNYGKLAVENGGRFENFSVFNQNADILSVRSGGALANHGALWVDGAGTLFVESHPAEFVNYGVCLTHNSGRDLEFAWSEGSDGRLITGTDSVSMGDRARWVSSESELRAALEDDACELVLWYGHEDRTKININGGSLTVTKGLILEGDSIHPVDLNASDITVTGENAFLITGNINFHGNGLAVEDGATVVVRPSEPAGPGRLEVSGGGLTCFANPLDMESGEVRVSGGGRIIDTSGGHWKDCTVQVDADGVLLAFDGPDLIRCDVTVDGYFENFFAYLYQEGGSFVNNGRTELTGWDDMVNLGGDVRNNGEMHIGGRQRIHGDMVNEAGASLTLGWENCPLRVFGRLENKGVIRAAAGTYVETVEGGVFTGNPVQFD